MIEVASYKTMADGGSYDFSSIRLPTGMPEGEEGRAIWDRAKQTQAELLECIKKGGTFPESP